MQFGRAIATAFAAGSNRSLAEGESDNAEAISPAQGLLGIAILVAVQIALLWAWSATSTSSQTLIDASTSAFVALAIPFVLFKVVARMRGLTERLPATYLYLGVTLSIVQLASTLLGSFGVSQIGVVLGLLFATMFLAARGLMRLGPWPAAGIALLIVAGFIGPNLMLNLSPAGRLIG